MADIRVVSNFRYTDRKTGLTQFKNWYINKGRGGATKLYTFWFDYQGQDPWTGTSIDEPWAVSKIEDLLNYSNDPKNRDVDVQAYGQTIKQAIESTVRPYIDGTKVAQKVVFNRSAHGTRGVVAPGTIKSNTQPQVTAPASTAGATATASAPTNNTNNINNGGTPVMEQLTFVRGTADKWYIIDENKGLVAFNLGLYGLIPQKGLVTSDTTVAMLIKALDSLNADNTISDEDVVNRMNAVIGEITQLYPTFLDFPMEPGFNITPSDFVTEPVATAQPAGLTKAEETALRKKCAQQLMNFMAGFHMDASRRLINTCRQLVNKSNRAVKKYMYDYTNLIDNGYEDAMAQQCKGQEFDQWLDDLKKIPASPAINKRLAIYYGPAGMGKTYDATHEKDCIGCIVCAPDKYESDLFRDYDPNKGQPVYKKTCLYEALVNGGTVVLDEINLLPLGVLQSLQGILDNKDEIDLFGEKVQIHPNFRVIGTMNLIVQGAKCPLPEALVDRCFCIKEYKADADTLGEAI